MQRNEPPLRQLIQEWAGQTYEEVSEVIGQPDLELPNVLGELELLQKNVDGNSVERLKKDIRGEGNLPRRFTFTYIFHELSLNGIPSPVTFLNEICRQYRTYLTTREDYSVPLWGICSRGMRTIASFYREVDFRDTITRMISERNFENFEIVQNPAQDAIGHADLLIIINGLEFKIWEYMLSQRGVVNTQDRLAGNRGALPPGIHILCGHDTKDDLQTQTVAGWNLPSDNFVESCLRRIEEIVNNEREPMPYARVQEIVNGPRDLLTERTAFIVNDDG